MHYFIIQPKGERAGVYEFNNIEEVYEKFSPDEFVIIDADDDEFDCEHPYAHIGSSIGDR